MARLGLAVEIESLRLSTPFRISGYTFDAATVAVARLTASGTTGRGEANGVFYFKDDPVSIRATIEAHRDAIEAGITRDELLRLLPAGGARNALDCALWDLEARRTGRPVWQLAGLPAVRPLLTTFTLSADEPAKVRAGAARYEHARAIKLKLDGDLHTDIARVWAVREARPAVWLGVDANQGYTIDNLDRLLPTLCDANVQLIEQPLATRPRGGPRRLQQSDCARRGRERPAFGGHRGTRRALHVINIKLDKCGGLTEALHMVDEARRVGLRTMVGCMIGTSLAVAPGLIVGQLCEVVDLDAPLILARDRTPAVRYEDGLLSSPEGLWGAYASN